jgi:hypothetical protein
MIDCPSYPFKAMPTQRADRSGGEFPSIFEGHAAMLVEFHSGFTVGVDSHRGAESSNSPPSSGESYANPM